MNIKYFAQPLWDMRPSEFQDEVGEVAETEIEIAGQSVIVVAPKGYELVDKDYARIEELIGDYGDLDQVMTAGEAAEEFGLAEPTVRQAINRGTIPARKSGGTWLILRRDAQQRWGNKS